MAPALLNPDNLLEDGLAGLARLSLADLAQVGSIPAIFLALSGLNRVLRPFQDE